MRATLQAAPRHTGLAGGRWQALTLVEQLANIGSEFSRAARAEATGNKVRFDAAGDRCLELFDLTLADDRWHGRRREIARAREMACSYLVGDTALDSDPESLERYFLSFAMGARRSAPKRA